MTIRCSADKIVPSSPHIALVTSAKLTGGTLEPASECAQKGAGLGVAQQEPDFTDTQSILAKILPRQLTAYLFDQVVKGGAFLF